MTVSRGPQCDTNLIILMEFLRPQRSENGSSISLCHLWGLQRLDLDQFVVGLLLLAALVGVGALALINATGQAQLPAASQPVPPR